jgi:ribosome-associated toxin RatA of RatAB toxin-antitoxin module
MKWDPFIQSMSFLGVATKVAKGVATRTIAYNGMEMDTEFIAYDPPNVIAMDMISGPWIFAKMAGTWRFHRAFGPRGETRVDFRYSFSTRPRLVAPILDRLVGWQLKRDMVRRIAALKAAAEARE